MDKVVVALSGGMDSATVLGLVKNDGYEVAQTVSFNYGSKHNQWENECALKLASHYAVPFQIIDLREVMKGFRSNLMLDGGAIPEGHYEDKSMEQTVVPGRNIIFASILSGVAWSVDAKSVWMGIHAGDHCLPALTPISTRRGLVPINEVEPGVDEVLSFDKGSNITKWSRVLEKVEKGIPTHILQITTRSGAVLQCTEEHKVYVAERTYKGRGCYDKTLVMKPAGALEFDDYLITPAGALDSLSVSPKEIDVLEQAPPLANGGNPLREEDGLLWFKEDNKVKRFVPLEAYVKLIAWYVTEGCPAHGNMSKPNRYGCYIAQSESKNPDNVRDILECAEGWGFRPKIHRSGKNTSVYFSGPTTRALRNCGDGSENKRLPDWFLGLNNNLLQTLFDTMIAGDGCYTSEQNQSYITNSLHLVRQMAYIGCRLGYKSSVSRMMHSDCWSVNFYRADHRPNTNRCGEGAMSPIVKIEKVRNIQPVYDLTVEGTHNFFAGSTVPVLVSNSIYPDCRPGFFEAMRLALKLGTDGRVALHAPFLFQNKTDILKTGLQLNNPVPYHLTRTCYKHQDTACGRCGSCSERLEAFARNNVEDPLPYESRVLIPK